MVAFFSALALLAHASPAAKPCEKPLPRGPAVPVPLVLSTDCGWFRLEPNGQVVALGADWLVKHKQQWQSPYGLTLGKRPRSGRYIVLRHGDVVWRSSGYYYNEAGSPAFGPGAFAFDSWGKRGVFLTDLRSPERMVVRGRFSYPIDFTREGELLVSGRRLITVVSRSGQIVRRYPYRRSTGFSFDPQSGLLYFVTPAGVLSEAHGSAVRRIAKIAAAGAISVLGTRLLAFTGDHELTILRRGDGSVVARGSWSGARRQLDAAPVVSGDGKRFAYRISTARPGVRRSLGVVYGLRAGERQAHVLYRHRMGRAGCGSGAGLGFHGSLLLYSSVDGSGIAEEVLFRPNGSQVRLTPLLRALPRISPFAGKVYWTTDFRM
jgi:hypothetical protein